MIRDLRVYFKEDVCPGCFNSLVKYGPDDNLGCTKFWKDCTNYQFMHFAISNIHIFRTLLYNDILYKTTFMLNDIKNNMHYYNHSYTQIISISFTQYHMPVEDAVILFKKSQKEFTNSLFNIINLL